VAIIGGGEGATLREVLKHKSVREGVQIDIDEDVMKMSEKYLPEWNAGCFKDKRARLLTADGRKFLADAGKGTYDIIIVDITEPVPGGPSYLLFTKEFYEIVSEKLSPNGLVALQAGTTACCDLALHAMIMRTLRTVFPIVRSFSIECPSFDLPWAISIGSKKLDPIKLSAGEVDKRIKARGLGPLGYYDGITHQGIFQVPRYMREALAKKGDIIEDNHPMFTAI
jgi:spermidine synthase